MRILGPQPGARVRSGRVVRVVVRVSVVADGAGGEGFPEELHDGEALPAGWTLVLSQDGQPEQTVGRAVGHIGDLRGLLDGVHSLRAWLADEAGRRQSADAATHFFVGSPRPGVSIMFPAPGSFVTDNPITVLFSAEEFEVPGDGFVVVSLDGVDMCAAREHALYHCDLRQVPAGNHSVAVTLLRERAAAVEGVGAGFPDELVAARQSVEFTVRRPEVAIVYPPPGAMVRPEPELSMHTPAARVSWMGVGNEELDGDSEVAMSVRLTVQHVTEQSPLLLRTELSAPRREGQGAAGAGEAWNHLQHIERADHYIVALLIPTRALLAASDAAKHAANPSSSSPSPATSPFLTLTVSLLAHPPSAYGLLGEQLGKERVNTGGAHKRWADAEVREEGGNCTCVNAACDACEPLHQFHLLSQVCLCLSLPSLPLSPGCVRGRALAARNVCVCVCVGGWVGGCLCVCVGVSKP